MLTDADASGAPVLEANADDDVHRRHRLDAHLLAGQDVDRRAGRAAQAAAAPAHAGQRVAAVGRDRHGLHEPQPGRARRPRVRLHPDPAGRRPQDRRRPLSATRRCRERVGAWAARRAGLARGAVAAAGPLRRQHARRRGDRGRQGRGAAALRRLGQHLRRQRPGRRRRRRRPTPTSTRWSPSTTSSTTSRRSCARRRAARVAALRGPASSSACGGFLEDGGFGRSPRTSRTSAACASCPASPCSG